MKIINNLMKASCVVLLLFMAVMGCRKSAPLEIEPAGRDTLFTFVPTHGYPGTSVKIQGSVLTGVNKVAIGSKEAEIQSSSSSEINILVPVGASTGKIKLVSDLAVFTSLKQFVVDDAPIPTIISFDPAIVGSGDLVTITGSLFDIVDSVYVGDLKVEVQPGGTATSMEILTPAGFQTGIIRMFYNYTTSYGTTKVAESKSKTELTLELPVISSITPDISSLDIGDTLTFTGTMFSELTNIFFGSVEAITYDIISDTEMKVVVPEGVTTGKIRLVVPDGETQSTSDFRINLPTILSYTPLKGAESPGEQRFFAIQGTNLSLVTSVTVGTTAGTITDQSATLLLFVIDGGAGGFISLITDNGTVQSDNPFFFLGDFWIADWDNTYVPDRMGRGDAFANVANAAVTTESGGPTGNYRKYVGDVLPGGGDLARIYWRDDDNKFSIFTSDPVGVTVEFDMSYTQVPATFINPDGSMDLHMFFFTVSRNPYGYSIDINIPFDGPDDWQHVVVELKEMTEDPNLYDGAPEAGAPKGTIKPNDLRILSPMFPGALNGDIAGETINVNFDNIKFKIQ